MILINHDSHHFLSLPYQLSAFLFFLLEVIRLLVDDGLTSTKNENLHFRFGYVLII